MSNKLESLFTADTQTVSPRPCAPTPTQHASDITLGHILSTQFHIRINVHWQS